MAEGAVSAAEDKTDTTAKTDTQDKKGTNAVETENMAVEHGDSVAQTDRCLRRRRRIRLRRIRLRRLRRRRRRCHLAAVRQAALHELSTPGGRLPVRRPTGVKWRESDVNRG